MWLLTGFLYQALIFYSTIAFEESADDEEASLEAGCAFDYAAELLIAVAEIPGVLLAHALIDRPCGPGGLLGGRRGTQWLPYALCAAATYGMSLRAAVGPTGVLVCGALARFCLSAASSEATAPSHEVIDALRAEADTLRKSDSSRTYAFAFDASKNAICPSHEAV